MDLFLKSAPKKLEEADYLAFYLTKVFGDQKWSISHWAEIKERRIVKRLELLSDEYNHPRAQDLYYKVEIGELNRLPNPIISKRGRRIAFITTTLRKFRSSKELNDLFNESPLEDKLWHEFKKNKIDAERQYYVTGEKENYYLDFAIFCENGSIDVECDGDTWHSQPDAIVRDNVRNNLLTSQGWSVLRFSSKDISENMTDCLNRVKDTVNRLDGIVTVDGELKVFREEDSDEVRQLDLFGENY